MRVVAFDIDGTLLLSGGAGARALDRAFLELHGVPDAFRGIHPHGMTDGDIIQEMGRRTLGRGMTDDEAALLRERYARLLQDELPRSEGFHLMPGVEALLRRLSREGDVLLGLVTGNYEETALMKLAHGGLDAYFRFGGYGSDSDERVELTRVGVERGRKMAGLAESDGAVFLVGDTVHDIRCGKEAGARVIAVATGSTSEEALRDHGPEWVLPDLTDIDGFLRILRS